MLSSYHLLLFFYFLKELIYLLFLAVLGLRCCTRAFSSCGEQGLLFVVVHGLLIAMSSLVMEHGLQVCRLHQLCMQAQQLWLAGSRAQAQQLWRTGLAAPRHVGSSWTRARTCVPCIGWWIPNQCVTREALLAFIYLHKYFATEILMRWLRKDAQLWTKHVMPWKSNWGPLNVEEELG